MDARLRRQDERSHDRTAADYDGQITRTFRPLHRLGLAPWVRALKHADPERVLDEGTGTGVVALELARVCQRVVGLDHSMGMLQVARAKCTSVGRESRMTFVRGDCHHLPFADGYVTLKGRKKDMIIVAGENVYATEVEAVLLEHEQVLEAAVVGIPATGARAYMGEVVKACVVTRPGETTSVNDLRRFCSKRLASYQVPQFVEFLTELPRNPSGKVLKSELRKRSV